MKQVLREIANGSILGLIGLVISVVVIVIMVLVNQM